VPNKPSLRIGLAGLGAVGLGVAQGLIAGVPGLTLAAVAVRDVDKARRALPQAGKSIAVCKATELADTCDVVVECLPPALFREVAISAIDKGRLFMPLSVAQLLHNDDLVARAKEKGARILVPTGALIGFDAVRAAAEGTIHSVNMVTRKPPAGLDGALYLIERGISVTGLKAPLKVFDGTAREGFPQTSTLPPRSASQASGQTAPTWKSGPTRVSPATSTPSRSRPIARASP
jgi:aspartate dehydrogenase